MPDSLLRLLRRLAKATLLYPLLVVLALYGEWLVAGLVLGHPPVPSWNDPTEIAGTGWLHTLTGLVMLGAMLALSASLVLHLALGWLPRFSWRHLAGRVLAFLAPWTALYLLLCWDPGRVMEWWLD